MDSVLIIRGGAIGDFILTLPSLHAFRNQYPKARLEILGYTRIAELAHGRFYADAVRSIDQRAVAGFFASKGDLDPELCRYFGSFDAVVNYLYDPDEYFLNNLKRAGARRTVVADGRPTREIHAIEHLSRWLPELGISSPAEFPKVYPTEADYQAAEPFFSNRTRPTVALHPGSGSPSKSWPVQRFLELAAWLKGRRLDVVVIDGPADTETQSQFWKDPASSGCIRCGQVSLPVLAAILQRCILFVGNDSGISHLSAAVDTPTVAIFGPTNPKLWGPRGKSVTILQKGSSVSDVTLADLQQTLDTLLKKRAASN